MEWGMKQHPNIWLPSALPEVLHIPSFNGPDVYPNDFSQLGARVILTDREEAPWVLDNIRGAVTANGLVLADNKLSPPATAPDPDGDLVDGSDNDVDSGVDGDVDGANVDVCSNGASVDCGGRRGRVSDGGRCRLGVVDGASKAGASHDGGTPASAACPDTTGTSVGATAAAAAADSASLSKENTSREQEEKTGVFDDSRRLYGDEAIGDREAERERGHEGASVRHPATLAEGECCVHGLSWGQITPSTIALARNRLPRLQV